MKKGPKTGFAVVSIRNHTQVAGSAWMGMFEERVAVLGNEMYSVHSGLWSLNFLYL